MWTYEQSSGRISHNGEFVARGYSGKGVHKNNPGSQNLRALGPIPQGTYRINPPRNSTKVGPYSLDLIPGKDNAMFGRSAFIIHGDSIRAPGTASSGCIILSRPIRERIWKSGDRNLTVVK